MFTFNFLFAFGFIHAGFNLPINNYRNNNLIGGCHSTLYGCCLDNTTACNNFDCSNCNSTYIHNTNHTYNQTKVNHSVIWRRRESDVVY